jgi:rsbT co-antagonist protein RsbR
VRDQATNALADVIIRKETEITRQWLEAQNKTAKRSSTADQQEVIRRSREFMETFRVACQSGDPDNVGSSAWQDVRGFLTDLSASRARSGYSPSETATFIFSLKHPLFTALREEALSADSLADEIWRATELIDKLGLLTMEAFQRTREDVISRQRQEMLELSTPVVRLWENILALPLIGTLDSARAQIVMQSLLDAIVATRSDFAIIDITGVPVVDTLVAQHLLKTVAAARLMGADCLISGIRPQIAQTIIHLGVDLTGVTTKATLADAFSLALRRSGMRVTKVRNAQPPAPGDPGAR